MRTIDMTGQRFGRLTVLAQSQSDSRGVRWHVRCDCGNGGIASGRDLRTGDTQSCGCLHRDVSAARMKVAAATHGATRNSKATPEYEAWRAMVRRCYDPRVKAYPNYGGRGIRVCSRWREDFAAFLADMGSRPSPAHSLDRKENDGNYEPRNCRWATDSQQNANRRAFSRRRKVA